MTNQVWMYEPDKGVAGGKLFDNVKDAPKGWLDHPTGKEPEPAAAAPKKDKGDKLDKDVAAAMDKLKVKVAEAEARAEEAEASVVSARARSAELSDFLAALAGQEKTPKALVAAIAELGIEPAAAAE